MSTRGVRGPTVRGNRRRKTVRELDLNIEPPDDNRDQEGTSTQVEPQNVQGSQQGQSVAPAANPIDVEDFDDDVIESSATAFAQAKVNSRRNRRRTIVEVDSEGRTRTATKRRRNNTNTISNHPVINLESNSYSTRESDTVQPPPPKEPTFSCPVCMGPLVEEMSPKCGHIFCKECIKAAISAQGKCPVCRKKVHQKELIRVFLPSTR